MKTMMKSCIAFMWALLIAGTSGAMGDSANPLLPTEQKGQQVNGLTWTVRLAKEFTVFDTVEAFCGLYNSSERQFTFDTGSPDAKRTYPQLVLTRKGGQRVVAELVPKKGFWHQYGNYNPNPDEVAHSFYVDIRLYFGVLQPGEYELQAVYPAAAYKLKDFPGFEARDITSPLMSFRVSDTSLAAAAQGQAMQQETGTGTGY
jgi:hypothetical protein